MRGVYCRTFSKNVIASIFHPWYNEIQESTHDRSGCLHFFVLAREYIRGEVVSMTAYEILSTIQDAAAFLVSVGIFVVTLLAFLDQRNKHK